MNAHVIPRTHDKDMPFEQLMPLVDVGDWDARAIYAQRLFFGYGIQPDPQKAVAIMHQASDAGSARSAAELGFRYLDGDGVLPRDLDRARAYANLAIERGNYFGWWAHALREESESNLQAAYEAGMKFAALAPEGERAPENIYIIAWLAHHTGHVADAVPLYEEAAIAGHESAAINLGLMIMRGECDLPNDRVVKLFHQASRLRSPAGLALFVQCLCFLDDSTPQAHPEMLAEAVGYLRQEIAAGSDYHYHAYLMAKLHDEGLGVPQDSVEATRLFALASQQETVDDGPPYVVPLGRASLAYARRLRLGLGTALDLKGAMAACERARDNAMQIVDNPGYSGTTDVIDDATFLAIEIAQESDRFSLKQRCISMLEASAKTGNVDLILPLAKLQYQINSNFDKARFWFVLAIAVDQPDAGVEAALMLLENGKLAQAYAFAQSAAASGVSLPATLASLSEHDRDKGGLFKKGATGTEAWAKLKQEIEEARQTYN